jgi:hypothetical protein
VATTNKDFRIKNGLVVEGTTSTVNGNQVLTTASSLDSLSDVVITTPTTNQVLSYNGTNWINSSSGGGGTTTNALTIGTGLSGTSFNGSAAVTIAIDSTVATLTGTQTLTNKTLTSPTIATPTMSRPVISAQGGSEGGEINLASPASGSTITNGINIDIFNNLLRFFEGGGTNRGMSIDITTLGATVGSTIATTDTTQTFTNKTLTSPTLTTPSIGVATGTSFNSITGLSSTTPSANGTAAVGTATTTARADHVHPTATVVSNTVTGTNSADLVLGSMADNDNFRIRIGGTATNTGFVEIATADDGTEPIHIRQYTGAFATLTRTATLLDASGNTVFPGTVSASGLAGSLLTSTVGTALGTAAAGTATVPARADHVHPTTGLGLTSGTLAQFAATTSSQLAGVISDETGSGALVFATSPTLVTPVLGAATGTSLALTGGSLTARPAATQDSVIIAGRAGGTSSFGVTITPTTLTASRTVTLANGNTTLQAGTMAITGGTLAQFAATTSDQLRGVISDETGSGALVFGTSPTIGTPTISSPTVTGSLTAGGTTGTSGQLLASTGSGIQWKTVSVPSNGDQFLLMGG